MSQEQKFLDSLQEKINKKAKAAVTKEFSDLLTSIVQNPIGSKLKINDKLVDFYSNELGSKPHAIPRKLAADPNNYPTDGFMIINSVKRGDSISRLEFLFDNIGEVLRDRMEYHQKRETNGIFAELNVLKKYLGDE